MVKQYRKKPVVIEAVEWDGMAESMRMIDEFCNAHSWNPAGLIIKTLEGDHHVSLGDMIIKGINGEFYPCKPDIFAKTYDEVK